MKKDIEWLKEEITEVLLTSKKDGTNYFYYKDLKEKIYNAVDQLDDPEVLSREWIDKKRKMGIYKDDNGRLMSYFALEDLKDLLVPKQEELEVKIQELIERYRNEDGKYSNPENAWIGGFIEDLENLLKEEQKYYIRDQHGVYLLAKNHGEQGNVQTVAEIIGQYGINKIELDYELTEQEIKDYDPRYWAFRKPVEELEK